MQGSERCFLVEWYQRMPAGTEAEDVCLRLTVAAEGVPADVLLVVSVPADETVFGLVRAHTVDAVTTLCRKVGLPADRITPGVSAHVAPSSGDSLDSPG